MIIIEMTYYQKIPKKFRPVSLLAAANVRITEGALCYYPASPPHRRSTDFEQTPPHLCGGKRAVRHGLENCILNCWLRGGGFVHQHRSKK